MCSGQKRRWLEELVWGLFCTGSFSNSLRTWLLIFISIYFFKNHLLFYCQLCYICWDNTRPPRYAVPFSSAKKYEQVEQAKDIQVILVTDNPRSKHLPRQHIFLNPSFEGAEKEWRRAFSGNRATGRFGSYTRCGWREEVIQKHTLTDTKYKQVVQVYLGVSRNQL